MERNSQKKDVVRPRQFVVTPFEVDTNRVKENPFRRNRGKLATESQALVQKFLVAELRKLNVPAEVGGTTKGDASTWIVSGKLTRVAEGNRLLRMGIGLGVGGTKMETLVEVRSGVRSTPFLRFGTTGGSNATPGAATMPIPFSSAPIAIWNAKDGVTADAARTARMISAAIAEHMAENGWLQGEYRKPKMMRQ